MSAGRLVKRLAFPFVMVAICVGVTLLVIRVNQSSEELRQQGKPATNVVTPSVGEPGKSAYEIAKDNGFKGTEAEWLASLVGLSARSVSSDEVQRAVDQYCERGRCDGRNPTADQVIAAVTNYCLSGQCRGQDGRSAEPVTEQQIGSAVAAYCADNRCVGAQGESVTGPAGANGRSPVISCVTRTANNESVHYIAWKYNDEADASYRDLYRLSSRVEPSNCVAVS